MDRNARRALTARIRAASLFAALALATPALALQGEPTLPALTKPVNDFAGVIDAESEARLDRAIRSLHEQTGDVVIVATVKTVQPFADAREYAVKLFENRGRGIGGKEQDTGLLVLLAVDDKQVWVEVGYGLEGFVTDRFAGDTSRRIMAPHFKEGRYGAGLVAGVEHIINRILERRKVEPGERPDKTEPGGSSLPFWLILLFFLLMIWIMSRAQRQSAAHRRARRGPWAQPWSGWPGGFSGGSWGSFGGGGFGGGGGGFGGFGGGMSGGGGGGASW
jgi:uncharacterized protein